MSIDDSLSKTFPHQDTRNQFSSASATTSMFLFRSPPHPQKPIIWSINLVFIPPGVTIEILPQTAAYCLLPSTVTFIAQRHPNRIEKSCCGLWFYTWGKSPNLLLLLLLLRVQLRQSLGPEPISSFGNANSHFPINTHKHTDGTWGVCVSSSSSLDRGAAIDIQLNRGVI